MMNTLTQIILLAVPTLLGIAGVIAGLLGRKTRLEKQKIAHVRKSRKTASAPAAAKQYTLLAAVSGALALIFGVWCGWVILAHALPDGSYVRTDIVIAENGYQDQRFTADGVVYEALPLTADDVACSEKATAVFTYKTKGFLNGYLTGNYYRIENPKGFDLIWNGVDRLLAPAGEREAILAYYFGEAIDWKYYDYAAVEGAEDPRGIALSDEAKAAMQAYLMLDVESLPTEAVIPEAYETISIAGKSSDGIVLHDLWFVVMEGKVYLELDRTETNDQRIQLTLAALPEEISAPLAKLAEGAGT